jgi:hypothetical protein
MDWMETFARAMVYLNFAAALTLLLRLQALELFRVYRSLLFYLGVYVLQFLIPLVVPLHSTLYGYLYIVGETANLAVSIFVVLELYRLALAGQRALAGFVGKSIGYTMGVACAIAAAGLLIDSTVLPGQSRIVHRFFTAERSMDFAILIFLLLITAFLMWFPVKLTRNIIIYIEGFAVLYFSRSFGLLATNLMPPTALDVMSSILLCVSLGCLAVWLLTLRRETEDTPATIGHRWNPAAVEHLTGQLETINAALARFGRR